MTSKRWNTITDVNIPTDPIARVYTTRDLLPFSVVAAMLRLGSKYEFNHLREDALFRLRAEFPTTLETWDELPPEYTYILEQDGILFDIINLAIEQGLWSILPSAYYVCIVQGNNVGLHRPVLSLF